ncbi:MAG: AsmA-like C-terminal region-containing protein [bacterium]|nr:AsmA-like C-terminal region-containing protein [bacterium]
MTDARPGILRKRRVWVSALLILLVAGVTWMVLSTPVETYFAGVLSRVLGKPVELAEFEINVGGELEFELSALRVLESDEPNAPEVFRVRKVRGRQTWPRILAGQIFPSSWTIDEPVLRMARSSEERSTSLPRIPEANVVVTNGSVDWQLEDGKWLQLRDLRLENQRGGLGMTSEGALSADLLRGGQAVGRLEFDFDGWLDDLNATGRVRDLDLTVLSDSVISANRRCEAEFELGYQAREARLKLNLDTKGLKLVVPGLSSPLEPQSAILEAQTQWRENYLSTSIGRLQIDDFVVSGELEFDLNTGGRVRGEIQLADFQPASPRINPLRLMGLRFASWGRIVERIQDGHIEDIRFRFDLRRRGIGKAIAFKRKLSAKEMQISLRVRDGVFAQKDGNPIRIISGEASLRGNILEAKKVHLERTGSTIPEINLHLDGMHRLVDLPKQEHGTPRGAGVPTPGLWPALGALGGSEEPSRETVSFQFENLRVDYPAFILGIRDASGSLDLPPGQVRINGAKGVIGGAPASFDVAYETANRIANVRIRYGDGPPEEPYREPGKTWLDGDVRVPRLFLGEWQLDDAVFHLAARGDHAEFSRISGTLDGGTVAGAGSISLADKDAAEYVFGLQVLDAKAELISTKIGIPKDALSGTASFNGRLAGVLARGEPFMERGNLKLLVRLEDGEVSGLPALLSVARLPSLQGVRGLLGRPLPFEIINAELKLAESMVEIRELKLDGPELRILADGVIDLKPEENTIDMVVALLFLQTVDKLLGSVPIVRDVVLGKNRNLLATYFRLDGPRTNPRARILAPSALNTATGVISGGLRRLRNLIPIGRSAKKEDGKKDEAPSP